MKPLSSTVVGRLFTAVALLGAFLVMASVFVPHQIEARDARERQPSLSGDPHAGLRLIGTLEHLNHSVQVFATDHGPRYSVYEIDGDGWRELGVLLSEDQMERHHPELPLRGVEFDGRQIMLTPVDGEW